MAHSVRQKKRTLIHYANCLKPFRVLCRIYSLTNVCVRPMAQPHSGVLRAIKIDVVHSGQHRARGKSNVQVPSAHSFDVIFCKYNDVLLNAVDCILQRFGRLESSNSNSDVGRSFALTAQLGNQSTSNTFVPRLRPPLSTQGKEKSVHNAGAFASVQGTVQMDQVGLCTHVVVASYVELLCADKRSAGLFRTRVHNPARRESLGLSTPHC